MHSFSIHTDLLHFWDGFLIKCEFWTVHSVTVIVSQTYVLRFCCCIISHCIYKQTKNNIYNIYPLVIIWAINSTGSCHLMQRNDILKWGKIHFLYIEVYLNSFFHNTFFFYQNQPQIKQIIWNPLDIIVYFIRSSLFFKLLKTIS